MRKFVTLIVLLSNLNGLEINPDRPKLELVKTNIVVKYYGLFHGKKNNYAVFSIENRNDKTAYARLVMKESDKKQLVESLILDAGPKTFLVDYNKEWAEKGVILYECTIEVKEIALTEIKVNKYF